MNKFHAIRAFTQVAEQGGFTGAARKLGMTVSAITKSIARLEDELGTQLFSRTTRRIALTIPGEEFYERCVHILRELDQAETAVKESRNAMQGRVRVVMPFSFGRVTMIPALPAFFERYPDITLDIDFSDTPIDLIQGGYDLAIRSGDLSDSRLIRRVLVKGPMITVAAPSYIARRGMPKTPADLADHDCIVSTRTGPDWSFQDGGRQTTMRVTGRLLVASGDALRESAAAGLGIAQWTWWLFRRDLEAGSVVQVLTDHVREGVPMCALYPTKRHMSKKVLTLIDYITEITRAELPRG